MTERLRIDRTTTVDAGQADEVAALVQTATATDGFEGMNEAALLALRYNDPGSTHLLARLGETLVGYAQLRELGGTSTAVLVVAPSARRRGVGSELLTQLIDNAGAPLHIWGMHDTEAARRLARRHQLVPARELLIMTRSLDAPVPEVATPADTRIRTFEVGRDEEAWLRVNARAFAHHPEQGSITRVDLDERMAEPWFDPSGFFVAERDGRMVGFHWTKQHEDHRGEVYVLGVDPEAGGGGLGTALLYSGLRHLAAAGNTEVLLYVEADHERAVKLYAANGFFESSRDVMYSEPVRGAQVGRD
jgi:mycothiol synthase